MDQEKFNEQVRKELGESINPIYVADILKKNIPDLLCWLQGKLNDTAPTVQETLHNSMRYQEDERMRDVLLFGVKILDNRLKFISFVLKEIKSRIEAVDVSTKPILEPSVAQGGLKENQ